MEVSAKDLRTAARPYGLLKATMSPENNQTPHRYLLQDENDSERKIHIPVYT